VRRRPDAVASAAVRCVECHDLARGEATGWRGYHLWRRRSDAVPEVVFYCPVCAFREFGPIPGHEVSEDDSPAQPY